MNRNRVNLYRGFNQIITNGVLENPFLKKPREPIHTKLEVHLIADNWFNEKLNIRARSQCIFGTTDLHTAHKYALRSEEGTLTQIVPIGNYTIIYSEKVDDFNDHSGEFKHSYIEIRSWLDAQEYKSIKCIKELPFDFKGEVMLYCEKYEVKVII
jgi:hypothetical protein